MMITNKLKLDMQNPGILPTIHAVQNDSYSRNLEIALLAGGKPFPVPENGTVVIRYKKSDGKGGEYDTLPDGRAAWQAAQNVLTVALAPQVLTTPGSVLLSVSLIADGTQLGMFPIRISVEPVAAAKMARSEDYFYITGLLPAPVSGKAGQVLRIAAVNDRGRITSVEAVDSAMPQKGIDYWTDADKDAMVQEVIAALGASVFGTVDENNNILLAGELAEGVYTLKYAFPDGTVATIGTLERTGNCTNQIPLSTDADGHIYNGVGYAEKTRISSSGVPKTLAYPDAPHGVFLTGFIPVKPGDVIRMKNCYLDVTAVLADKHLLYGNMPSAIPTVFYDAGKNQLAQVMWESMHQPNDWLSCTVDAEGYVTEFTVTGDAAYMRISPAPVGSAADAVITVNEQIG